MASEYIEREAAYNAIVNNYMVDDQLQDLFSIPTADVRPVVRAHFGKHTSPFTAPCSDCGTSMNIHWNFCPNCGALMEKS